MKGSANVSPRMEALATLGLLERAASDAPLHREGPRAGRHLLSSHKPIWRFCDPKYAKDARFFPDGRPLFGFPAPVVMLVIAVLLKLTRAVSPTLQVGAFHVYKFFSTAVTYPLLFAIGVALTPWDKLVAAFTLPYVVTIVATVVTIIATGFVVGGWLKMYPIDTAIVTACHSGQGGTGDVAILTAGNRMQLMPFAQIATRIGGAITVTTVLIALTQIG